MITTLALKNFRGFADLKLEGLQRINLVVGRNNAGKTSLLEGIAAVADTQQLKNLPTLLRPAHASGSPRLPVQRSEQNYFRWLVKDGSKIDEAVIIAKTQTEKRMVSLRKKTKGQQPASQGFTTVVNHKQITAAIPQNQPALECHVVSVLPRSPAEIVELFGAAVSRKGGEERMDSIFHQLDERIRKVRVIASPEDGFQVRFDFNLTEMVPLAQVGQGIHRLITIFSELIVEDSDLCIIDELENGIHHSMLEQVWTGIAAAAEQLDVQVFATTHSQECIEAAHAAFSKRESYDFSIIQLFRVDEGVQGRVLDRKHIEAAIAGEIDLR